MGIIEFKPIDPDDPMLQPVYGPRCPGIDTHPWTLVIEEGRMVLGSGCHDCDDAVLGPVGGEDVEMYTPITGTLKSHVEVGGWETPEYNHWWEFVPTGIGDPDGAG